MTKINRWKITTLFLAVTGAMICSAPLARAGEQELQEKIKALEKRLEELEGKTLKNDTVTPQTLEFLGKTAVSGFVSASFFHNFNDANPSANAFVTKNDAFTLHKLKLALEKPVDYDKDKWNAGFRADLVAGEDAKVIHASGLGDSDQPFDLEQAYLTLNIPIGNGLKLALGKMVTLMGVEVIEETANPNWSVGNQFLFAENFTQLGGLLSYKWNDNIETVFAVFNGWDKVTDNNNALSYMGKINFTLTDKTAIALLGYGGPEQNDNTSHWRKGAEIILTQKIGNKLTLYLQGDYGQEDNAALAGGNAEWFAAGLWAVYQFTDKIGLALRADYLADDGSSRTGFDPTGNVNLTSLTLTLNFTPIKNLQVRPEIRWDHCSETAFSDGDNAKRDQILLGLGVAYIF